MFSKQLKDILSTKVEIDDAAFISVDSKGTTVRVRQGAQVQVIPEKESENYPCFLTSLFIVFFNFYNCAQNSQSGQNHHHRLC